MATPVDSLKNVLELARKKKYTDNAVVGGLDRYLLRFAQEANLSSDSRFTQVLQSLPPGGYRALHVIQRRRIVEELLKAVGNGMPVSPTTAPASQLKGEKSAGD